MFLSIIILLPGSLFNCTGLSPIFNVFRCFPRLFSCGLNSPVSLAIKTTYRFIYQNNFVRLMMRPVPSLVPQVVTPARLERRIDPTWCLSFKSDQSALSIYVAPNMLFTSFKQLLNDSLTAPLLSWPCSQGCVLPLDFQFGRAADLAVVVVPMSTAFVTSII